MLRCFLGSASAAAPNRRGRSIELKDHSSFIDRLSTPRKGRSGDVQQMAEGEGSGLLPGVTGERRTPRSPSVKRSMAVSHGQTTPLRATASPSVDKSSPTVSLPLKPLAKLKPQHNAAKVSPISKVSMCMLNITLNITVLKDDGALVCMFQLLHFVMGLVHGVKNNEFCCVVLAASY